MLILTVWMLMESYSSLSNQFGSMKATSVKGGRRDVDGMGAVLSELLGHTSALTEPTVGFFSFFPFIYLTSWPVSPTPSCPPSPSPGFPLLTPNLLLFLSIQEKAGLPWVSTKHGLSSCSKTEHPQVLRLGFLAKNGTVLTLRRFITSSKGTSVIRQTSREPGMGWAALGSNSFPTSCKLNFWSPKHNAFRSPWLGERKRRTRLPRWVWTYCKKENRPLHSGRWSI